MVLAVVLAVVSAVVLAVVVRVLAVAVLALALRDGRRRGWPSQSRGGLAISS